MELTRKQMEEIAAFDWQKRMMASIDVGAGYKVPRRTIRYNYIVVERARRGRRGAKPGVTVLNVAVRLDGAYRTVVKEVGMWDIASGKLKFRDMDYHGLGGWIVEWRKEDWAGGRGTGNGQRGTVRLGKPVDRDWSDAVEWKFNAGLTFPWFETVNPEALKGTRFEYCQYEDGIKCKAGLVDWLMLYQKEPKVELLAKTGLYTLICPAGIKALKDRRVRDWVIANRQMLAERDDICDIADVLYAARHGVTITEAVKRMEFVRVMARMLEDARYRASQANVRLRIDYDRLRKLMGKWKVERREYARYLDHAIRAGLDPRNEGTLYPPTKGGRAAFMARLEAVEAECERLRRAEERRRRREEKAAAEAEAKKIAELMATRITEIEAFQSAVERSLAIKADGFTLVLAKSQHELLAEGKKMGNCVGMGMYGKGIALGDRLIVMVKRGTGNGERGMESYCDIEIERKHWTVKQCYLKHNQRAPKEMHELAERIAATLKAEWKRRKKRRMFPELEEGRKRLFVGKGAA